MVKPVDYKQYDSRWAYNDYSTVGEKTNIYVSGCGPTSAAMAIASIKDKSVTPATCAKWSLTNGYKVCGAGTANAYFVPQFAAYGIKCEYLDGWAYHILSHPSHKRAREELKKGNWLIANPGPGTWTSGGHFILVYGIDENDNVYINDPASTNPARLKNTFDTLAYQTKCYWVITVPDSIKNEGLTNRDSIGSSKSYLQYGDTGKEVLTAQTMLEKIGYYNGELDSSFGPMMRDAVKNLQTDNKLTVDGLYGTKTRELVEKLYSRILVQETGFVVGKTYTLLYDLKVRTGASTNFAWKKYKDLTDDGKKNSYASNTYAVLKAGTKVTCYDVSTYSKDETWIQIPSGWIAAVYGGQVYVQ